MKKLTAILLIAVMTAGLLAGCNSNKKAYEEAEALFNSGKYEEAAAAFEALGNHEDSAQKAAEARQLIAKALLEKLQFDPSEAMNFKPDNPKPEYYFVCAVPVIDPVTGFVSTGGYNKDTSRHLPVDAERVLGAGRDLGGGLLETNDPNLATYVLIVTFTYDNGNNKFPFADGTSVPQYRGATEAELRNMISGRSIHSKSRTTYATLAGESVSRQMLDNARGKQFYADYSSVKSSDFEGFDTFIKR
ncbi:MAG: hypothetical protein FWG31_00570 [Oscillospiraceae bacterium]|nr:hypothetical protein [Oscillospiraceae bacterium]